MYVLTMLDNASCFPRWEAVAAGTAAIVRDAVLDLPLNVNWAIIDRCGRVKRHNGKRPSEAAAEKAAKAAEVGVAAMRQYEFV